MADPSVIIDFEPNWDIPPEMAYAFSTVIQTTPHFKEQRRPLLPSAVRSMKCNYMLEGGEAQRLADTLIYGATKLIGIPIYSEPLFPSSIIQGSFFISVAEDVSYLWNLHHCSYAIIIDFIAHTSELLFVANASLTTIYLQQGISGSFTAANCIIYPAFAGIVKAFDKTPASDLVFSVEAEFEEFTEHAEATPTATSLTVQLCPEDVVGSGYFEYPLSFTDPVFTVDPTNKPGSTTYAVNSNSIRMIGAEGYRMAVAVYGTVSNSYHMVDEEEYITFSFTVRSIPALAHSSTAVLRIVDTEGYMWSPYGPVFMLRIPNGWPTNPAWFATYSRGSFVDICSVSNAFPATFYVKMSVTGAASALIEVFSDSARTVLLGSATCLPQEVDGVWYLPLSLYEFMSDYNFEYEAFDFELNDLIVHKKID